MSLIDEIKIKSLSDAQEILKSAGSEDIFEKAHKDGDLHPNGKWVWVSSANGGKGDWRTLNGRTHKKHQATTGSSDSATQNNKSKDEKFIKTFKDADDNVLQKIISGKIQSTDREKQLAKKIFDDRKNSSKSQKKTLNGKNSVKVDIDTIDQTEYNRMYNQAKGVDEKSIKFGLVHIISNINKYKKDLEDTISNRPGAKATIKKLQNDLTKFISQKKAAEDVIRVNLKSKTSALDKLLDDDPEAYEAVSMSDDIDWLKLQLDSEDKIYADAVKERISEIEKQTNSKNKINPTFQKYFSISNSKFTDPKKMSVSKTPQGNWSLSYEGKRISTVAPLTDADKKKLESAGVTFDDTFNTKQKVKTNSETYSHDINGVTVNVSKNKDGSYTLEANGKKVRSDDPSFFRDKLKPRIKKALAKEVGIDVKNPTKQFDIKQIGDFISSIKTTHGDVSFVHKNGTIYLGKQRDYIGDYDEEDKTIELRQDDLSNVKRDREAIKEISDALQEKFGFVSKTTYKANPRHGLKKAYMKIVLKPS